MRRIGLAAALSLLLTIASLQPVLAALASPDEGPARVPVRVEGHLKLLDGDRWLVGAHAVVLDAGTTVIEKRGRAEVGAWLSVEGAKDEQGTVMARVIVVQRPAGLSGPLRQFSGVVMKQLTHRWVIDDAVVEITADTRITGGPKPGWLVWVVTEDRADHLDLVAIAIEGLASQSDNQPVEFEGVLDSIAPKWSVNGRPFVLHPNAALIGGDPAPGTRVELRATEAPGGTLTVHLIRVVDTSADARLNALVAAISVQPNGGQVWDIVAFADEPYGEPLAGVLHVDANALVDESRAVVHPGLWAEVQGITIDRDEFQADVVRLEEPIPAALTGRIESAGPGAASGWYTLEGQPLWVAPTMHSQADAAAGDTVMVHGQRLGNGVVWVERITSVSASVR